MKELAELEQKSLQKELAGIPTPSVSVSSINKGNIKVPG